MKDSIISDKNNGLKVLLTRTFLIAIIWFSCIINGFAQLAGSIEGDTTVCQDSRDVYVTFTGSFGEAPYVFTYSVNNQEEQMIFSTDTDSVVKLSVPTEIPGTYIYELIHISDAGSSQVFINESVTIIVNPRPEAPLAVITRPTCAEPTGTITITSPLGDDIEYSLDGLAWQSATVFTALVPDSTYTVFVRDNSVDPTCISSAEFDIDPVPGAPDIPAAVITHPTCAEPTGTLAITSPLGDDIEYSLDGVAWQSDPVFAALSPAQSYTVYVRDNSVDPTCISSAEFDIDPVPGAPNIPVAVITQPTCAEPTGTITITSPLGDDIEYSLDEVIWQSATVFTALAPDSTYTVFVRDNSVDPTCVSSSTFDIDPVPDLPEVPAAVITQPTCAEPTGTLAITSPLGADIEYSLDGVVWQSDPIFTTLSPAQSYTVYVRDNSVDATCISSAEFDIDPVPDLPEVPVAVITQPTCAVPSGTITITSPLGADIEYSLDGLAWRSDPVFASLAPNSNYTIYVRDNSVDPTCISSAEFDIDPVPDLPDAPLAVITHPTCAEPTGTIAITSPLGADIEYSLDELAWQSAPVFTDLDPDSTYTVYVRDNSVDPTCVSSSAFDIDPVPGAPDIPVAVITQPTCAEPTGTITITSPLGDDMEYSLDGVVWQSDPVFAALSPAQSYTIYVRDNSVDPTCISSAEFDIDPVPDLPDTPLAVITQPTCALPSGTITITSPLGDDMEYSLDGVAWQSAPVFTALSSAQSYTVYVRDNSVDPTCISSAEFDIDPVPGAPDIPAAVITQPTCAEPTGTITITSPLGDDMEYSLDGVAWQSAPVFTALSSAQSYTVYVRDNSVDPTCISSAGFDIDPVPDLPDTPLAVITQPTCAEPTGSIAIISPLGADIEYSFDGLAWQSDPVFAALSPAQSYTVYVRDNSVDPTCISSAEFDIDSVPGAPDIPAAVITQPTCAEPTGTIAITSPLGDDIEYSLDEVIWQSATVFTALSPAQSYTVFVRDNSVDPTCISSAEFDIDPVPGAPDIPVAVITRPTCAEPTGTITITSPLGDDMEYSLDGVVWQSDPVFTALDAGQSYTVYVRDNSVDATCVSSSTFDIDPVPGAPDIPAAVITQPTCAEPTGSIAIISPLGDDIEYSFDGLAWQSDPVFVALSTAQSYTIYVRDNSVDPTCISSAEFDIDPVPGAPDIPVAVITQPTCAVPNGTITITSPLGDDIEYSLDGVVWQSDPVFDALAPNSNYTVYVRDNSIDPTCVSSSTFNIDPVPDLPEVPAAVITQPTCAEPTGIIAITSPLGDDIEYSLDEVIWQSATVFTALSPAQSYTIYVRDNSVDPTCISSAEFDIDPVPGAPDIPVAVITQPTCAVPGGTITITSPLGDDMEYSLDGVAWQSDPVFAALAPNSNYTIYVRDNSVDPTCISSSEFDIDPVPGAPDIPLAVITQPTCAVPNGTITITSPLGADIEYSLDGVVWQSDPVFTALSPAQSYTVYVRDNSVDPTCVSSSTFDIDPVPGAPDIPVAVITQPTCAEPTGTIAITSPLGADIEYSLDGVVWQSDPVFAVLVPNSNYTIYVRDNSVDPTCISSAEFDIDPVPGAPDIPVAVITQPTCAVPGGTITITSPLGDDMEYSLDGVAWQSDPVFAALAPNSNYTIYVRDNSVDPTCISSSEFDIDPVPGAPDIPLAVITQPTCAVPNGTITITSPLGADIEYSIDGVVWQSDPVFTALSPAQSYTVYVRDNSVDPTCVSSSTFDIDPVPGAPDIPVAVITQPTCAEPTGTIAITSPLGADIEYSLDGVVWQSDPVLTALSSAQSYTVYVRDNSVDPTCISSAEFDIDPVPGAPEAPLAVITHPTCAEPTGTITITSPLGDDMEYSLDGLFWQSAPVFAALDAGQSYTVYVRDNSVDATCISSAEYDIDPAPVTPGEISGDSIICQGGNINLLCSPSGGTWSSSDPAIALIDPVTGIVTGISGGTVEIRYLLESGCSSSSLLSVIPLPGEAGMISGPEVFIPGTYGISYSVPTVSDADSYLWSYSGSGVVINGSGHSVTLDFLENATEGQLSVRGVNECGTGDESFFDLSFDTRILNISSLMIEGLYYRLGEMRQARGESGPQWPAGIADVITVELHRADNYSVIEHTFPDVQLGIFGNASITMPASINSSYYITIKHRNSIETTSARAVSFSEKVINQSFGSREDVYGANLKASRDGYYMIYSGDVNQDRVIDTRDFTGVDNDSYNYASGYLVTDIDGNGIVDTRDFTPIDNNNYNYINAILP